ncbi:MAG: DUF5916 domain-containing protein [Puniceicoccaceae bacterium]
MPLLVLHVSGQDRPQVPAIRISEKIVLDGRLDEPAWDAATPIGDLIQQQPDTGQAPSENTDIYVLFDADTLYIGVIAHDSEPDRIIATSMARDGSISSDDRIEILLDTFRDQRNAYYFATNPAGASVDGLAYGNGKLNTDWDTIWDLRTQRTDDGWTVEIAIPFKSLSFPANDSTWGFNFSRNIYRKLEQDRWSGARLEADFLNVSEAGSITGLSGLNQGMGLDVRPFIAGSWLSNRESGDDHDFDPGLDIFYNITPNLKFTGTINTDFGETEVDARQINLSRFSLFFPEKRAFFLEDAGVFDFASTGPVPPGGIAGTGADVYPFFSRRIGLLQGEEVPMILGGKLTGTIGSRDVGILYAQTDSTDLVGKKDFIVARFKQNIFEQSYIGGIFTDGHSTAGNSGQTYGVDLHLATSNFLDRRNLVFDAYLLKGKTDGISEKDLSYGFWIRYPNDKWDAKFVFREIQENFNPGIGFVQRKNVRMYRVAGSYNPRPKNFLNIQQAFHDIYYTHFERLDTGKVESYELYITPLDWHFYSGDSLHALADVSHRFERLFEPFRIAPGVILPVGDYRFNRSKFVVSTARKRPLSGSLNIGWGEYWSGHAEEVSLSFTYKLPPWITASVRTRQTFAHLPEGDFTARVHSATLNLTLSRSLTFSNLVQYDNRSRILGWQSRMHWTIKPGSDFFVSFNQGWEHDNAGRFSFYPTESKVSVKLQYTFRF